MNNILEFPLIFKRQYGESLICDEVFTTLQKMTDYLANEARYAGMIVTCLEKEGSIFIMNNDLTGWIEFNIDEKFDIVTNLEALTAYPIADRKVGLTVYVIDENSNYRLEQGIENENWKLVERIRKPIELKYADVTENDSLHTAIEKIIGKLNIQPYKIVGTLAERDAIIEAHRLNGMICFVKENQNEYRLIGGLTNDKWIFQKTIMNNSILSVDTSYYVDIVNGSDVTGTGTAENPWQSIQKALKNIPTTLTANGTIYLKAGNYTLDTETLNLLNEFTINVKLEFNGEVGLVTSDYTTSGKPAANNPFNKNLTDGQTFDVENKYFGYYAKSGKYYSPIGKHGLTDLTSIDFSQGGNLNGGIYEALVTITLTDNLLPVNLKGSSRIRFKTVKFQFASKQAKFISRNLIVEFDSCFILPFGNNNIMLRGYFEIIRSMVISATTTKCVFKLDNSKYVKIESNFIFNINPITSRNSVFELSNSDLIFQMALVDGFAYIFDTRQNVTISQYYGHYPIMISNCGCIFLLKNSLIYNKGVWYGTNKMFIENVGYLFSLNGAIQNVNIDLRNYIQNNMTPTNGYFVTATSSVWQVADGLVKPLQDKPEKNSDPTKNFNILYDGLYLENDSANITGLIPNNSTSINIGSNLQNSAIKIFGIVKRDNNYKMFEVKIFDTNDIENLVMTQSTNNIDGSDTTGTTITFTLEGDILKMYVNADDSMNNSVDVKCDISRLMI